MTTVISIIHVLTCLLLIGVVLLQQGKGADMGAVFGGSSSTIFGSGGAGNFLTRLTTAGAIVFMLTSLSLTYLSARRLGTTVFDTAPLPEPPPLEAPVGSGGGQAPIGVAPEAQAPAAQGEPQAAAEGGVAPAAPGSGAEAPPPAAAPAAPEHAAPVEP